MPIPCRIAMWSGPRNISTAMMRAWENRPDTVVVDEPFYAYYLARTGIDHPGAAEIIAHYDTYWRSIAAALTGDIPGGRAIYYQKHMTHHMLDEIDLDWLLPLTNCFLIREPAQVIISLAKVLPNPSLEQTGFPRQVELFEFVRRETGITPPVIDARDVLTDPRGALTVLCDRIGVPFTDAMLHWQPGSRPTDGIWAKYWYAGVEQSTGFAPYQPPAESVPDSLRGLLARAQDLYDQMAQYRLTGAGTP